MTALLWDQLGERTYETGVDRGVLYPREGGGVAWNGLISVTERAVTQEGTALIFDGMKYGDSINLGDFAGTIRAYTYPDEFMDCEGIVDGGNGLLLTNQPPARFGMSYRTKIGNDEDGLEHGYKIHLLYNLTAFPSPKAYQTSNDINPTIFEWNVVGVPEKADGYRATAHIILDTRSMSPILIADLEQTLYGTAIDAPTLPPLSTLVRFIGAWVIIRITDNLDGTWTAEGPDEMFTMVSATEFSIINANATYLDADTYTVSDTTY